MDTIKLTIDNREVEVPKGTTILKAAEQMGIGHEVAGEYVQMQQKITDEYENQKELFDSISQYSADQLRDIDHADGAWSAGEQEIENLCDALEISYDDADMLVNALAGLGLIETPEFIDTLPDAFREGKEAVGEFLETHTKFQGMPFDLDLDADISKMSGSELEHRLSEISDLKKDIEKEFGSDSEAMNYLNDLEKRSQIQFEIQTKINDRDLTVSQLKEMSDEDLAKKFDVEVNSEEFQILKEQIDSLPSDYDMVVHVDDTQFEQLIEAITGEDYEAWVKLHTDDQEVTTTENELENEEVVIPVKYKGTTGSGGHTPLGQGKKIELDSNVQPSGQKVITSKDLVNTVTDSIGSFANGLVNEFNVAKDKIDAKKKEDIAKARIEETEVKNQQYQAQQEAEKQANLAKEKLRKQQEEAKQNRIEDYAPTSRSSFQSQNGEKMHRNDEPHHIQTANTIDEIAEKEVEAIDKALEEKQNRIEDYAPTSRSSFQSQNGKKMHGNDEPHRIQAANTLVKELGSNAPTASVIAQDSTFVRSSQDVVDTSLLFPAIANYISEYYRAIDSGFEQEFSNGFDSTYGNIDMNNRPLIQWTQEAIDHYKEQLASWTYEDEPNGYQPEIGSYDTVHGGSDRFGEDILETGVEVAFTPMMKTEDGRTEFLGKDTVYNYIEDLVGKATENGQFSVEKLLAADADTQHGGLGIIAGADTSLNYDPYDPNANKAFRYGEMMHFAGDYGAIQLAINQLNTAGVDEQFVQSQIQSLETLANLYNQDAEKAQGYFDVLMNTPTDELQQIILSNGVYDTTNIAAENALQGIADQAGISKDEVLQLLDVIKQLNQQNIEQPEGSSRQPDTGVSSTEVPVTGEEGERIITLQAVVKDDQVESDVAQIRNDVESTKIEITPELMVSNLLSKAQSFLSSIQGKIAGAMSSQPSQPSQPQSTEATATIDTSGVDKGTAKVDKAMNSLGKETATARVNVDIGQAMAAISSVRANLMTISGISVNINANSSSLVTAAGRAANLSQKLSEVIAKKNQAGMAVGTAHASGTVGIGHKISGIISRSFDDGTVDEDEFEEVEFDAFANGKSQDWTVGKNEKALVNEIGQESLV